jgi:hypothetical protein
MDIAIWPAQTAKAGEFDVPKQRIGEIQWGSYIHKLIYINRFSHLGRDPIKGLDMLPEGVYFAFT